MSRAKLAYRQSFQQRPRAPVRDLEASERVPAAKLLPGTVKAFHSVGRSARQVILKPLAKAVLCPGGASDVLDPTLRPIDHIDPAPGRCLEPCSRYRERLEGRVGELLQ